MSFGENGGSGLVRTTANVILDGMGKSPHRPKTHYLSRCERLVRGFTVGGAWLFAALGCLKLLDGLSGHAYLKQPNAFLPWLLNGQVLFLAACVELAVAVYVVKTRCLTRRLWAILWMVSVLAVYRLALKATRASAPCSCFGLLGTALGLDEATAGKLAWAMIVTLACCVIALLSLIVTGRSAVRTARGGE